MTCRRKGLTLIELVAACVLASIMMVALLRVVVVMAGETEQLRRQRFDRVAAGFLADRMRDDLLNARGMLVTESSIALSGFLGEGQLPGRVVYRRIELPDASVLVRQAATKTDLLWVGFGRFDYQPLETIELSEGDAAIPTPDAGGLPAVPSAFRIALRDDAGRHVLSEVITHHAN